MTPNMEQMAHEVSLATTEALKHALAAQEGAVAILHVGAVAAVLCACYAGLDRGELKIESGETRLSGANSQSSGVLLAGPTLGLGDFFWRRTTQGAQQRRLRLRLVRSFFMRARIEDAENFASGEASSQRVQVKEIRMQPIETVVCMIDQIWNLPLLLFLNARTDKWVITFVAFATMSGFFWVAHGLINHREFEGPIVNWAFWFFALPTFAVFMLSLLRWRSSTKRAGKCYDEATAAIDRDLPKWLALMQSEVQEAVQQLETMLQSVPAGSAADEVPQPAPSLRPPALTTREKFLLAIQRGDIRQFDAVDLDQFRFTLGAPGDYYNELMRLSNEGHIRIDGGAFFVTDEGRRYASSWAAPSGATATG